MTQSLAEFTPPHPPPSTEWLNIFLKTVQIPLPLVHCCCTLEAALLLLLDRVEFKVSVAARLMSATRLASFALLDLLDRVEFNVSTSTVAATGFRPRRRGAEGV